MTQGQAREVLNDPADAIISHFLQQVDDAALLWVLLGVLRNCRSGTDEEADQEDMCS